MIDTKHRTDLVGSLVADLEPVRPVSISRIVLMTMAIEILAVKLTALALGAKMTALDRLADPMFVGLLSVLGTGAATSAATMARLSIPGRAVTAGVRVGILALPIVLAVAIVVLSPWGGTWTGFGTVCLAGVACMRNTIVIAAPGWIAGLLYLRRFAPLDPLGTGLFAASTALLCSAIMVHMACPSCDSWHLAVAHYAPILVAAWVAAFLSLPVLRR